MKTVLTLIISVLFVSNAQSQSLEISRDTIRQESTDPHAVVTNRFFDNWFIGGGVGAQVFFGDHNKQMKFTERITPGFEFYAGKWFTPGIGVRAAFNGLKNVGLTQNQSHSTGEVYDASQRLYKQEFNYLNIHGDVLFNLSQMLGGYRADRAFSVSPYLGLGWMFTRDAPRAREVSANIGIYNTLSVSRFIDLTLDVRGSLVDDGFDGELGERKEEGMLTAAFGLAYKFPKRTWDKPVTTTISYNEAELNAMRKRVNDLAADNESLKTLLAEAKDKTVTNVEVRRDVLVSPILITFPINKSVVSNEARVNLGFFAEAIKESQSAIVYRITGYADKGTGNPQINERLSKERAMAIYNVLVNEFGVPASRLSTDHKGGVDNMFYNDARLSRAVITIGE